MNIALYLSLPKPREIAIGQALKAGFEAHGDRVTVLATADYAGAREKTQLAVTIGIKGRSKAVFDDHLRSARHALLVDKSYFGRSEFLRLALDGFQPRSLHAEERPHDRLQRLGVRFGAPRAPQKRGVVIYAGSSQKYCDWHGLGDATAYATGVCHAINKVFGTGNELKSSRVVLYRPKPSWVAGHAEDARPVPETVFSGPDVKLAALLPDCHALVTHGSNAAVEAVAAGIPVVVLERGTCGAERVANLDLEADLPRPGFPGEDERRQWAANLAYHQFTLEEISSGYAWGLIQKHTWKAHEKRVGGMNDLQGVIEQYRLMHGNPKMFRGRLADVYCAEIAALCQETSAETLLDYGSGKGHQYSLHRQHETHAFPEPHCYDPGVMELAQKPKGQFDGVLCLDVMEHIPEAHVEEVLAEIFAYARKFVFLVIFTAPARKHLPDGRNCHLSVQPPAWWDEKIARHGRGQRLVVHYKGRDE